MNRRTVLKGGLVLAATAHTAALAPVIADPLLDAIQDYQRGCEEFNRCVEAGVSSDDWDALENVTFGPALARVQQWRGPALSMDGAIAALRISLLDSGGVNGMEAQERMVEAALGYLESLAA